MGLIAVITGIMVGVSLRYFISLIPHKSKFPIVILAMNLVGAVGIGFLAGMGKAGNFPEFATMIFEKGVPKGFLLMAVLSPEMFRLFEDKEKAKAFLYALISIVLCFAGQWLGEFLGTMWVITLV